MGHSGEAGNLSPIPRWQPQTFHSLYRLRYPESESRSFYYEIMADLDLCLELSFPLLQNEMALASDVLIHAMVIHNMHQNRKDYLRYEGVSATSTGILNIHLCKGVLHKPGRDEVRLAKTAPRRFVISIFSILLLIHVRY